MVRDLPQVQNHALRSIDLDFIRGLAILAVMDFHFPHPLLAGPLLALGFPHIGWVGVDVFFVLSGFLIGRLLFDEINLTGRIGITRFILRRILKLWPQYYFYLLCIAICGRHTLRYLCGNLFHMQNYLGGIPHTWSLAVEEHCYVLIVVILAIACSTQRPILCTGIVTSLMIASIEVGRFLLAAHGASISYATHTRGDSILIGLLLAVALHSRAEIFGKLQKHTSFWVALLLAALWCLHRTPSDMVQQSLDYSAATAIGVCLIMLLYRMDVTPQRRLPYRSAAWIGRYAYGLYLWHVAIIRPVASMSSLVPHRALWLWNALAPYAAAIGVAFVLSRLVELPILRLRDHWLPGSHPSGVSTFGSSDADAEIEEPTPLSLKMPKVSR